MSEAKRGRPHTFSDEWMGFLRSLHSGKVHTKRQLQNIANATRAIHILEAVGDGRDRSIVERRQNQQRSGHV